MKPLEGFEAKIRLLKSAVKAGKNKTAVNLLSRVEYELVPRDLLVSFAEIANEAGISLMALKILNPIVRGKNAEESTSREILQYAIALFTIGATKEAGEILMTERSDWQPERIYYLAQVHLESWDTRRAFDLLETFLADCGKEAPLYAEALKQLVFCLRFHGEFDEALGLLPDGGFDFQVQYTQTVRDLFSNDKSGHSLGRLKKVREEARANEEWELLRETEFYLAIKERDEKLLARLFFGTPFEGFRQRLQQAYTGRWELPLEYFWETASNEDSPRVFDLFLGVEVGKASAKLKVGQVLHRLFVSLTADFYRPARVAQLFERVFVGEHYDPKTSPGRVHQIVKRLKKTMLRLNIEVKVDEKNGMYSVQIERGYCIRISRQHLALRRRHPLYVRLEIALPDDSFSIQQAAESLGLSRRFARKILERAEQHGWVQMTGRGRMTRYDFTRES